MSNRLFEWYNTFNWWETYFFLPLGIFLAFTVFVALCISIISRANDIHMNKKTDYSKLWASLLWPIMIPYAIIEWPAQGVARYKDYKSRKKFKNVA